MLMQDYLREIEFAATKLIAIIEAELATVRELTETTRRLTAETEEGYSRAYELTLDDDPETFMMGVGEHWDTYFGPDKERYHANIGLREAEVRLAPHRFSLDSLSGNLLQYARKGISLAHGGLERCPNGRPLGSQFLKDVIWQGRNQAIHWEDRRLHPPTEICFKRLEAEVDAKFGEYKMRSLAFEIAELLGWSDFGKFRQDLISLA